MFTDLPGGALYAYTGGKPFNPAQPTVVFVHGVLNDHSVWILQSRYLAHHGWNVLAIDLPGHGRSAGAPPASVEAGADAVLALADALSLGTGGPALALVGHSWGSLIALEAASRAPQRVGQLVLVGTAFPMSVSPTLLEWSQTDPMRAIDLVNTYSHFTLAPPPSALGPGTWLYGASRALMRRVLARNPQGNLFHTGFVACDRYAHGPQAMAAFTGPTLFILGERDQMAPPKAAAALVREARQGHVVRLPAGHSLMTEAPDGVLQALLGFLKP